MGRIFKSCSLSFFLSLLLVLGSLVAVIWYWGAFLPPGTRPPTRPFHLWGTRFGSNVEFNIAAVVPPKPLFPLSLTGWFVVDLQIGDRHFSTEDPQYQCLSNATSAVITVISSPEDPDNYFVIINDIAQCASIVNRGPDSSTLAIVQSSYIRGPSNSSYLMFKLPHDSHGSITSESDGRLYRASPCYNCPVPLGLISTPSPAPPQIQEDPLTSNNYNGDQWDEGLDCTFSSEGYKVHESKSVDYHLCSLHSYSFSNFHLQVQMTIVQGDCGGVTFRYTSDTQEYYYFKLCQGGNYWLLLVNAQTQEQQGQPLDQGILSFFKDQESNTIFLQANGANLLIGLLSPDGGLEQPLVKVSDSTLIEGTIALIAKSDKKETEVEYSNFSTCNLGTPGCYVINVSGGIQPIPQNP